MKKISTSIILVLIAIILVIPSGVLAQGNSSVGNQVRQNVQEKIQQQVANVKDKMASNQGTEKEKVLARVRVAARVRVGIFNRAIGLSERLLNRIQLRINKAQAAGKDIAELNRLMSEAKTSLENAKTTLVGINGEQTVDKAGFEAIKAKFKAIRQDLQTVRQDAAKMIKILKGFNSATSAGQNSQATSTAATP